MNALLTGSAAGFTAAMRAGEVGVLGFAATYTTAARRVAAVAGVFGVAFGAHQIKEFIASNIEAIDTMKDQAESVGVTTDALSRFQYAASFAGVEAEGVTNALGKMLMNLDAASEEGGAAVAQLRELGLSAKDLKQMAPDQAFLAIADAIAGMSLAADRATAAGKIFGKGIGRELLPVLNQGAAAIEAFGRKADAMGVTVRQVDAAAVEQAADAMQDVGWAVTGVGRSVAVELAPYITAASDELVAFATEGEGMGPKVTDAVEWIASTVATASDYVSLGVAGWHAFKGTVILVAAGVVKAIDLMGSGLVGLMNLLPGVDVEWTSTFSDMAESMSADVIREMDAAGDTFNQFASGSSAAAVAQTFAKIKESAAAAAASGSGGFGKMANEAARAAAESKKLDDQIAKLKQEVATFGMSGADKLASDLKAAGASDTQTAEAVGYQRELDALEAKKKAREEDEQEVKKYYEATRTAAEKYATEIEKINALVAAGKLDADTAQRARDAAQKTLDESDTPAKKAEQAEGPKLLQSGSQAAASFVASIERRQAGEDQQKTLVAQGKQQVKALQTIANNTGKESTEIVVSF